MIHAFTATLASRRAPLARAALALALASFSGACRESAELPVGAGIGAHPTLPPPTHALVATAEIAPARGWPPGGAPKVAGDLAVTALASGLQHPRWLYVLPNGDVLVAETNGPPRPDNEKGVKGWVTKRMYKKAGSAGPSAERITLLRDKDGDGRAETRTTFARNLTSPFGMALIGTNFYVADTDAILRFPYVANADALAGGGVKLTDLPAGPLNHHWTKNILASADGTKLYATVGSNSNAAENGLDKETDRASIWEIDVATGNHRVFATGLRNPCGLAWEPNTGTTGALWTVVNERDELGSDVPPDYLTSVRAGGFYGWPYSYFGTHVDERVKPQRPDLVARAIVPDYALGAHTASLGLVRADGNALPDRFAHGMFVGQHGSWNRRPRSGYKVIFVPFWRGKPTGEPLDVVTGFVDAAGEANGRPVGVALDKTGALLVADDVGNTVWRVSTAPARAARQ
ncbi:MAG: sorbosone dehydrogenase family protein [Myxococcales bacterium]|nr:sorbosone dehydrogenase family protein [Myxococcales bacterium]